jgi:hypothetical protein
MSCPSCWRRTAAGRAAPVRDHRALVLSTRLGWRACGSGERKQLDAFLLARALEHDAPGVLLQLACDWLRHERIMRTSADTLSCRVAAARDGARAETYHRLAPLLDPPRWARLDALLDVDDELGMTRLAWLRRMATAATPEVVKAELAKLEFLRARRRSTGSISVADRSAADAGQDRPSVHQPGVATHRCRPSTSDPAGDAGRDLRRGPRRAGTAARPSAGLVERARVEIDRGRLLDEVLDILADPAVSDADASQLVRARIDMPRLRAARRPTAEREPRDHGHFDLLAARYKYLRTFTPAVIATLPLTGNSASPDVVALLDAVDVLAN